MGNRIVCDLCEQPLMPEFSDNGYKVTVKKLVHSYDGFSPWIRKIKLDLCQKCINKIVKQAALLSDRKGKV